MHIAVNDELTRRCVNRRRLRTLGRYFMGRAHRTGDGVRFAEVSVVLADDDTIQPLNRRHLSHDYATDVIAFRYDPVPVPGRVVQAGELILNVERTEQVAAARAGWPASRELALYLAHGCDHLCGASDDRRADRARMRRRELRWLRDAERLGLVAGLVGPAEKAARARGAGGG
jgi:rRNA maturation RNase YbeY